MPKRVSIKVSTDGFNWEDLEDEESGKSVLEYAQKLKVKDKTMLNKSEEDLSKALSLTGGNLKAIVNNLPKEPKTLTYTLIKLNGDTVVDLNGNCLASYEVLKHFVNDNADNLKLLPTSETYISLRLPEEVCYQDTKVNDYPVTLNPLFTEVESLGDKIKEDVKEKRIMEVEVCSAYWASDTGIHCMRHSRDIWFNKDSFLYNLLTGIFEDADDKLAPVYLSEGDEPDYYSLNGIEFHKLTEDENEYYVIYPNENGD
jgi:hypothetical protein